MPPSGIVVVPVTGQASVAGWTSIVQLVPWWRWNDGLCNPSSAQDRLSSRQWCSQGWLKIAPFRWILGLTDVSGRKPCMKLTTVASAGVVSSLGASSWHCPCPPPPPRARGKPLIQLTGSDSGDTVVSFPPWRHCLSCSWSPQNGKT
jgi:hypothetical protein